MIRAALLAIAATLVFSSTTYAQAIGGPEKGRAVRRMHNHADATYHVFTLLTGQLALTVTATIVEVFGKAPKQ